MSVDHLIIRSIDEVAAALRDIADAIREAAGAPISGKGATVPGSGMIRYAQASKRTGIPEGTLRALVHGGKVPFVRVGPRSVLFKEEDLDAWMNAKKEDLDAWMNAKKVTP